MELGLAKLGLSALRRMFNLGGEVAAQDAARETSVVMARDVLLRQGERALDGKVLRRTAAQAGLEGGHIAKELKVDQLGQKYMVKGFKHGQEYRAYGDKIGADVARALGLETPAVHVSRRNLAGKRQLTTVQAFVEHSGLRLPADPHQLTKQQIDELTTSQVVRWLLGDHDGKTANFLVKKDGGVMAIDFGNMFRFFGEDKLAKTYAPNWEEPVYNRIWDAYAKGTLPVDFRPGLRMAERIRKMSDRQYRALIEPYAVARYATADIPAGMPTVEAFLDAAIARKNDIQRDVAGFYHELARERGLAGGLMEALKLSSK